MDILLSVISSSFVSLGLVWLFRSWISARLENAIRHEYEVRFEKIRFASADCQRRRLNIDIIIWNRG